MLLSGTTMRSDVFRRKGLQIYGYHPNALRDDDASRLLVISCDGNICGDSYGNYSQRHQYDDENEIHCSSSKSSIFLGRSMTPWKTTPRNIDASTM